MYELLSQPIRKYIRDKRWEELRPIQTAAIQHILGSEKHLILASQTASGKTEAAFLPILSKVNFKESGVKVLYISPLIALINDQFNRVEQLCEYLDVPVTKWHGEASKSAKDKLIKEPSGVVLITPESLEAMLDNVPTNAARLFSGLEFIVIDEIHAFIGTDRGVQLKSILSRLGILTKQNFRVIGLSATLGEFSEVKKMTGESDNTLVLRDKSRKEMQVTFGYFPSSGTDLPEELIEDLYESTKNSKVLIFPNSRGRAEEIAVRLKKTAERRGGHSYYFSHHSSVDKELREHIERFAKENERYPFAISCTSTLELGIDIGSVDLVVQIDAAHSVASLIQRTGRSGRQEHNSSRLLFYATDPWSLLQSLACIELYNQEFIETIYFADQPFDVLAHQILAIVRQLSGCTFEKLKAQHKENYAFSQITSEQLTLLTRELIKTDHLELIGNELIIGVKGEKIVNSRDFYSMFRTEPSYKVYYQSKGIGEIPLESIIKEDDNILLAAKIWKIKVIDYDAKKIAVVPAYDGKKPKFFGSGADIHPRVRQEMLQILYSDNEYAVLNQDATEALKQLRNEFKQHRVEDLLFGRPVFLKTSELVFYSFQGTRINRALQFILSNMNIDSVYIEHTSSFHLKIGSGELGQILLQARNQITQVDSLLEHQLTINPALIDASKWGSLLSIQFQAMVLRQKYYDFEGLDRFLNDVTLVN
jgi:ATP-dependent Lhr-like helicase